MKLIQIILMILISITAFSQESDEKKAITETIQNYFVGYDKGDVELLKKAFHPECVIKYNDIRSKKYKTLTMWQLNDFMKHLPEGWSSSPKLYSINIHESIAQAKVSVNIPLYNLTWTDFISLLKVNGKWMIVSKISHGEIKPK